jgi:hypothetical protein
MTDKDYKICSNYKNRYGPNHYLREPYPFGNERLHSINTQYKYLKKIGIIFADYFSEIIVAADNFYSSSFLNYQGLALVFLLISGKYSAVFRKTYDSVLI